MTCSVDCEVEWRRMLHTCHKLSLEKNSCHNFFPLYLDESSYNDIPGKQMDMWEKPEWLLTRVKYT